MHKENGRLLAVLTGRGKGAGLLLPSLMNTPRRARGRSAGRAASVPGVRLRRVPAALLMLAAALALLLSGDGGAAQAQSTQALVSNLGQTGADAYGFATRDFAQEFETGGNPTGYTLTSIELDLLVVGVGAFPTVKLFSGSANGTEVATLTAPGSVSSGRAVYTYTAPTGTTLAKDTSYWVEAEGTTASWVVASTTEDATPAPGWSIADQREERTRGTTGAFSATTESALAVRVNGTINPLVLLVSNIDDATAGSGPLSGITSPKRAQLFTTGANETGYTLISIEISLTTVSGTDPPTITLHSGSEKGTKVADFNGPMALTANTTANYAYTPTATVTLDETTKYWVVAGDASNLVAWTHSSIDPPADPRTGWRIDARGSFSVFGGNFSPAENSHRVRVNGTINPPPPLVSNIGQSGSNFSGFIQFDIAQEFETGGNDSGYTLTSIELELIVSGVSGLPVVKLFSGSATGTEVAMLTAPASAPSGKAAYTYTAPTGATLLAKDTSYWVVAEGGTANWYSAGVGEDATPAPGWSIADQGELRSLNSNGAFSVTTSSAQAIRVNGTVNPVVLVSNLAQLGHSESALGINGDLAQSFTTGGARYPLTSIELRYVTAAGTVAPTVTLHSGSGTGTKVADFTGPTALTASVTKNYEYTPTTDVTLAASTEYWVVAQDGSNTVKWQYTQSDDEDAGHAGGWSIADKGGDRDDESTGAFDDVNYAFKLRVHGHVTNNPAAGAPSIAAPNVFRVPAALGVDFSNITDGNGVSGIAGTATYNWQRFAAGGTTLEADGIGTDATYALTGADAGKTLKVVVSFTDDGGFSEGPLTSAATSTITAAATCNPPTYVGGATQVWTGKVGIGRQSAGSNAVNYGYYNRAYYNPGSSEIGSLVGPQLVIGSSRTIDSLQVAETNSVVSDLSIGLRGAATTALTDAQKRQRVLHVCGTPFGFAAATHTETALTQFYRWSTPGIDWSGHAERTIYISQDSVAPSAELATVNGTELVITFNEPLGEAASLASSVFSGKKTPDGGSETDLAFTSDAPSIVGNTLMLTLASASSVVGTDEDVKVTYTKPTGTDNKVVDLFGNEMGDFTLVNVVNRLADMTPPTLSDAVLAADGVTLTLTFSEPLKEASVPASTTFTVKATPAGGSEAAAPLAGTDPVTVSGSTVKLKLAAPIAHNDTAVKVSYAKPTSGTVIEDVLGNDLATFPDRAVTNNSTVPRVSIAAVYADASPAIARAEFRVTRSNTGAALSVNVAVTQADSYLFSTTQTITISAGNTMATKSFRSIYTGNTSGDLTLTVSGGADHLPALAPGDSATVRMKVPASDPTVKVAHGQVHVAVTEGERLDLVAVFTTGSGVAQPRTRIGAAFYSEESGNATIIQDYTHFSRQLFVNPGDWNAIGSRYLFAYTVPVNIVDDDEYEVDETFKALFGHIPGESGALALPTGSAFRATVTIVDDDPLAVQSVEVTSTTGAFYRVGNTISFTVNFNGAVTVTGMPRLAFNLGGRIRQAGYASGSDSTDLVFSYRVVIGDEDHDGISWGANALGLNGGSIKFMHTDPAEQVDAVLDHAAQGALSAQKVDGTKPTLVEAVVDQTTLTLTFHEELNTTAPANTAFTVKVDGGSGTNPTDVSISGRVVTLTLGAAVTPDQTVTVTYTEPSINQIKDLSGLRADSFTDEGVEPASDVVNFRAAPGNRRVTLSWDDPNDNTIVRYQYRYMSTSDSGWNPDWRNISGSGAGTTSYTAAGLTNGIEYTFQVRPVYTPDAPGKEGEVKSVPRGPLTAPRNLAAASAGDGEIVLVWDDPNDITITGYQYRYRNTSDSGWNPDWTDIPGSGASTATHTLTGLTNNLLYTVEVRAVRDATEGPSARDMETPRGPLAAPASFAAASGEDRQVTLSWDSSGDDSITEYEYRYRVSSETGWNPDWTSIPGSRWTTTSYTVTGLSNRTGYTFEVRALRGSRRGPEAAASATPEGPPTVPLAPGSLDADGNDKSITVWWQRPAGEDARAPVTSYSVRYREAGTSSWRNVSRAGGDLSHRQVISGLANRTHYEVQVAAVNRVGTGAWASARATPQGPTAPPPNPEGNETFDVGTLSTYWNKLFHPDARRNLLQIESCSGSLTFRVIWAGPAQNRSQADEWAAHVNTTGGAGRVSYSFSSSPGVHGGNYFEMNGTVRVEGTSSLTIQVRGRFGSNWGSWSPRSSLYCLETQ